MRHQSHSYRTRVPIAAAEQFAQLRHVLSLVEALSASEGSSPRDAALDEAARVASAYEKAEPIVQRRFGILAEEIASWSTAGAEALLAAGEGHSQAAVRRLADELAEGLSDLSQLLQLEGLPAAAADGRPPEAIPSP
jgi:hypothetical protein